MTRERDEKEPQPGTPPDPDTTLDPDITTDPDGTPKENPSGLVYELVG